ncbi:MAG TPA: multicopper oxidase domain-containing protein, partial [Geminicoccaceae bacterium]|nr:multicopper oxidase domain-containing protein [Geminicoccaceae bacterium]
AGALPSLGGAFDVPLVIQDRMFYPDGRLAYPDQPAASVAGCEPWPDGAVSTLPEFFGDVILVNGKSWPFLEVEPAIYRLRFLNGCNSRFLSLTLSPALAFTILGTEGGFLPSAVGSRELVMGPAERFDVLVDFRGAAGRTVTLINKGAKKPFPKGTPPNPRADGLVMQFRVRQSATMAPEITAPLPAVLNETAAPGTLPADATRRVLLFEGVDGFGRIMPLLGTVSAGLVATPLMWEDEITEAPQAGTVETWEIYNTTADAHPIHIHEVFFSVIDRQGIRFEKKAAMAAVCGAPPPTFAVSLIGQPKAAPAYERGFKDTVITYPGEVTRIRVDFRDAQPGRFVWHCHILEHEDHEMMRPYDIVG